MSEQKNTDFEKKAQTETKKYSIGEIERINSANFNGKLCVALEENGNKLLLFPTPIVIQEEGFEKHEFLAIAEDGLKLIRIYKDHHNTGADYISHLILDGLENEEKAASSIDYAYSKNKSLKYVKFGDEFAYKKPISKRSKTFFTVDKDSLIIDKSGKKIKVNYNYKLIKIEPDDKKVEQIIEANKNRVKKTQETKEKMSELIREKLTHLLKDFTDKDPGRFIQGHEKTPVLLRAPDGSLIEKQPQEFKVLKRWFTALVTSLELVIAGNVIQDPQAREKIKLFIKKYASEDFANQKLTTPENIQEGDEIINLVLAIPPPPKPQNNPPTSPIK